MLHSINDNVLNRLKQRSEGNKSENKRAVKTL